MNEKDFINELLFGKKIKEVKNKDKFFKMTGLDPFLMFAERPVFVKNEKTNEHWLIADVKVFKVKKGAEKEIMKKMKELF
ncbi:MAG: hypothetical protein NZ893_02640 [Candidatus Aenigmarchaeota archaeon]|nr:hypothetical protein [Candidatus Aenigmarchaeota archaeon]